MQVCCTFHLTSIAGSCPACCASLLSFSQHALQLSDNQIQGNLIGCHLMSASDSQWLHAAGLHVPHVSKAVLLVLYVHYFWSCPVFL